MDWIKRVKELRLRMSGFRFFGGLIGWMVVLFRDNWRREEREDRFSILIINNLNILI